jgi:hypothetical protein
MQTEMGNAVRTDACTFDERWAAWVAKGAEQDKKLKKRAVAAAAAIFSGLALWAANVVLFG